MSDFFKNMNHGKEYGPGGISQWIAIQTHEGSARLYSFRSNSYVDARQKAERHFSNGLTFSVYRNPVVVSE